MRVYFAATYSMRDQILPYAKELEAVGITVTSRWLSEDEKLNVQISDLPVEKHLFYGTRDIEDVFDADVLVAVNDPEKHVRQGRTAEFGMATMINHIAKTFRRQSAHDIMPILVLGGDHEQIFHYQPEVTHFATWETLKAALIVMRDSKVYEGI